MSPGISKERVIVLFAMCVLFAVLFTVGFVSGEDPIYHTDYAGFHAQLKHFRELWEISPKSFIQATYYSISSSDYNVSPVLLPLLLEPVMGMERTAFILSLVVFYLAPLGLILPFIAWRVFGEEKKKQAPFILTACLTVSVFAFTGFWAPTLMGMPDIGGILPLAVAFYIAFKTDISQKCSPKEMVLLGLSIYLCILLRRWYAFTLSSFYLAYGITSLPNIIKSKKSAIFTVLNIVTAAVITFLCIYILQYPLLKRILMESNYHYSYAAFWRPYTNSFRGIIDLPSPFTLFMCIVAPFISMYKKKNRRQILFLVLFLCILFYSFATLQGLGPQHKLPFLLALWLIFAFSVINIYQILPPQKYLKECFASIVLLSFLLSFRHSLIRPLPRSLGFFVSSIRITPLRHANFPELQRLMFDLEKLAKNGAGTISVFSCTDILSDSLLANNAGKHTQAAIIYTPHIDRRDGLPFESLHSNIAVVADTPEIKNVNDQKVILVPAEKILKQEGIGKAYRQIGDCYDMGKVYWMEKNATACVFERYREFTPEEVTDFLSAFPEESKQWPNFIKWE